MIFGWGKKKEEEEEEEEIELVTFQGALNKVEPDLKENAKLVQAGLVKAKEIVTDALMKRAEMIRLEPKGQAAVATFYIDGIPTPGARMPAQTGLAVTQMLKLLAGWTSRSGTSRSRVASRPSSMNCPGKSASTASP